MFTKCYWKIKISKGNVIGMIKIGQNCHRLNMNNLIFFFVFSPRRIAQEANFLVIDNTGQYFTTEGNSQKGKY